MHCERMMDLLEVLRSPQLRCSCPGVGWADEGVVVQLDNLVRQDIMPWHAKQGGERTAVEVEGEETEEE